MEMAEEGQGRQCGFLVLVSLSLNFVDIDVAQGNAACQYNTAMGVQCVVLRQ